MTRHSRLLPSLALGIVSTTVIAQSDAPPWWGVVDDVTVSLHWNFDTPFPPGQPPLQPNLQVAPSWDNNPVVVTNWTASANIRHIPTLNGHTGVLGLTGTGGLTQANLSLTVDNDPHLDWVKIFWFQYEEFEGATGSVAYELAEGLGQYGRANVTETRAGIGFGWERVTVSAELIPQPDDEEIDWTFLDTAFGNAAIDNLYVSSKCVKPRPDEDGDAMGSLQTQPINLTLATGGRTCQAVAVTRGATAGAARRYWVSAVALNAASPHQVIEMSNTGTVVGTPVPLPSPAVAAPLGATDLAVESIRMPGGMFQEYVYAIVDLRPTGPPRIYQLDANNNGTLVGTTVLNAFPSVGVNQRLGLAFDPSGNFGQGTFWVSAPSLVPGSTRWSAYEFDRNTGALIDSKDDSFPGSSSGIAYDETLGNFYCFSSDPVMNPSGVPIRVNGYEVSAFGDTFRETGVRFCGDLTLPGAGGIAAGLEVYRTFGGQRSQLRFVCVTQLGNAQILYELAGPFRYGYSRYGTCGMRNGPPFVGGSFDLTLRGVPTSLLAVAFLGTGSSIIPLSPNPFEERIVSVLPSAASAFMPPILPGEFSLTINLPPSPALGYVETYWQWVLLDSTAPGLIGLSQAGKTVIYP